MAKAAYGTYSGMSKSDYMKQYYLTTRREKFGAVRKNKNKNPVRGRMYAIRSNARIRANKKGWGFDLSVDFLEDLWNKQQGLCALTGEAMLLDKQDFRWSSALCSLDRIDPKGGYTQDNVQLTTAKANYAKGAMSMNEFVSLAKQVVKSHG